MRNLEVQGGFVKSGRSLEGQSEAFPTKNMKIEFTSR